MRPLNVSECLTDAGRPDAGLPSTDAGVPEDDGGLPPVVVLPHVPRALPVPDCGCSSVDTAGLAALVTLVARRRRRGRNR
jgi:MYXO-CTERM domain-containing protein